MGYIEEVSCDVCGKVKGGTNHWFVASPPGKGWGEQSLVILAFDLTLLKEHITRDVICGEGCLGKWISQNAPSLHSVGAAVKPLASSVLNQNDIPIPVCLHGISMCMRCEQCELDSGYTAARSDATKPTYEAIHSLTMHCVICDDFINMEDWAAHCNGHEMDREKESDRTRAYRADYQQREES